MKRALAGMLCTGAIATVWAVAIVAQNAPPDRAAVEKTIMDQERKVSAAFVKNDQATMKMFISDDGAMFDPMQGYKTVAQMYKELPTMQIKLTEENLSDFKFTWADPNTVVAAYTWTGKGTVMGQPVPSPAYASTVWTKRGNRWVAIWHQETPGMPPMKK